MCDLVTLTRRFLLGAAGAGTATGGGTTTFAITTPPDGTWPSATDAFYISSTGVSIIGFGDNTSYFKVGQFTNTSSAWTQAIVGGPVSTDQHDRPAVIRRSSDGRFVVVFAAHGTNHVHRRISTNPDDISSWGTDAEIQSELGPSSAVSYPALFELSDGLYLFYRDFDGIANWCIAKSTDGGVSWARVANLGYAVRAYSRCFKSSSTRLDFAMTTGSYCEDKASMYHLYYDSGSWFKSDGTPISGSPPFLATAGTLVYDGSTSGCRFPNSIAKSGSNIVITVPVQTGTCSGHIGADEDYLYLSWNGSAWSTHTIQASVGATTIDFTEGGVVVDPANLNHVILSKRVAGGSGTWRIWDYLTADGGATWAKTQVTSTGAEDRYPWFIRDYAAGLSYVWLKGTFTDEYHFSDAIYGAS